MSAPPLLFWRRYLERPLGIGAIAPSSRALARAMVEALAPAPGDTVVELGPGTGVFTRALLERVIEREKLVLIESDEAFAEHLERGFPGIEVIRGDARELPRLLASRSIGQVTRLLSGLPLRSMPENVRREIAAAMTAALSSGGRLVQFTYFASPPLPSD